jgi:hypothetical protein
MLWVSASSTTTTPGQTSARSSSRDTTSPGRAASRMSTSIGLGSRRTTRAPCLSSFVAGSAIQSPTRSLSALRSETVTISSGRGGGPRSA